MAKTAAQKFLVTLADYSDEFVRASDIAKEHVEAILSSLPFRAHLVSSRPKSIQSVKRKLRSKKYKDPASEITDVIGLRVITYYSDEVDQVVESLKQQLDYDKERSIDKRFVLGPNGFGYRSVHLIVKMRTEHAHSYATRYLSNSFFEIQVRSILDHAWAEIEHEVIYKSAIKSDDLKRRFAAIAGTLHILEREFLSLRSEQRQLSLVYIDRLKRGELLSTQPLDSCVLSAYMAFQFPDATGWITKQSSFPPHSDALCVEALKLCEIETVGDLRSAIKNRRLRERLKKYAALTGIGANEVSHFAIVALLISVLDQELFSDFFPSLADGLMLG